MARKAHKRKLAPAEPDFAPSTNMKFSGNAFGNESIERQPSSTSSKTLGRPSESPVKQGWDQQSSSPKQFDSTPAEPSTPNPAEQGGKKKKNKHVKEARENQGGSSPSRRLLPPPPNRPNGALAAISGSTSHEFMMLRLTLVATPSLRTFWDPKRELRALRATYDYPETPAVRSIGLTEPFEIFSLQELKTCGEVFVESIGNCPPAAHPRYSKSFEESTGKLQTHYLIWTLGGLAALGSETQYGNYLREAKQVAALYGEVKIFVTIGNGRLLGDGTVIEF
ncbi:MAG: hypothetical protein Q9162_000095 [Coniocarpon cinnabarinum]